MADTLSLTDYVTTLGDAGVSGSGGGYEDSGTTPVNNGNRGSIWNSVFSNLGDSLMGVSSVINAVNGRPPVVFNNPQPTGFTANGGNMQWIWIALAVLVIIVLIVLMKK